MISSVKTTSDTSTDLPPMNLQEWDKIIVGRLTIEQFLIWGELLNTSEQLISPYQTNSLSHVVF